jgi:hypothetical protein
MREGGCSSTESQQAWGDPGTWAPQSTRRSELRSETTMLSAAWGTWRHSGGQVARSWRQAHKRVVYVVAAERKARTANATMRKAGSDVEAGANTGMHSTAAATRGSRDESADDMRNANSPAGRAAACSRAEGPSLQRKTGPAVHAELLSCRRRRGFTRVQRQCRKQRTRRFGCSLSSIRARRVVGAGAGE